MTCCVVLCVAIPSLTDYTCGNVVFCPGFRNLIIRMLAKKPKERITLPEVPHSTL